MKNLAFLLFLASSTALADRPRMSPMDDSPDPVQEAPAEREIQSDDFESIFSSLSENCKNKDLEGFLSNFTKSRASAIRSKMKKAMGESASMRPMGVDVESNDGSVAVVKAKYCWDLPTYTDTNLIVSEFSLKMDKGRWKIDSEKVIDSRVVAKSEFTRINLNAGFAADDGFVDFGNGNDDDDDWPAIPSDARTYEGSCANGRCGMAR